MTMTDPDHITETIARAMHTALMNVRGVTIEDIRNRVPAVITALTEAGYRISKVEVEEND